MNTGETLEVDVDYGTTYDPELAETQTLTGKILLPEGVDIGRGEVFTQDIPAEFEVNVTVSPQIKLIVGVETTEDLHIKVGEAPSFPTKLRVTFEDGTSEEIVVTWTSDSFNSMIPGVYKFTANPVGDYAFGDEAAVQVVITVIVEETSAPQGCGSAVGAQLTPFAVLILVIAVLEQKRRRS